jgi:hypothetical protein
VALDLFRDVVAVLRRRHYSEVHPAVVLRVSARKYTIKSVAKGEAVKAYGRGDRRRQDLAPKTGTSPLFEPKVRHTKQRLAEETPANSGTDLIIL